MKERSAKGMRGFLLKDIDGDFLFRIYSEDKKTFKDYRIMHNDLEIEIIDDEDASVYEEVNDPDGYDGFIDYPSRVLGKKIDN